MIKLHDDYELLADEYTTVDDITEIIKNPDYSIVGNNYLSNQCQEFLEVLEPGDKILCVTWYVNITMGSQWYLIQDCNGKYKYMIDGWIC